jgi:hypothetical protein
VRQLSYELRICFSINGSRSNVQQFQPELPPDGAHNQS